MCPADPRPSSIIRHPRLSPVKYNIFSVLLCTNGFTFVPSAAARSAAIQLATYGVPSSAVLPIAARCLVPCYAASPHDISPCDHHLARRQDETARNVNEHQGQADHLQPDPSPRDGSLVGTAASPRHPSSTRSGWYCWCWYSTPVRKAGSWLPTPLTLSRRAH